MKLNQIFQTTIKPTPPYNFKYSAQNPSHYPTPTGKNTNDAMWFTLRWRDQPIGIRLKNTGSTQKPAVEITIYSDKKFNCDALVKELAYRFEWFEDYSEFYQKFPNPIFKKYVGMRLFCAEDLYDYLMITIFLQNCTAKRTAQMTQTMLEKYGTVLEFDGQNHYCFWSPERLLRASEQELRDLKVGYRAKTFLRVSQDLVDGKLDEITMRSLDSEALKKALLAIYGVGPASLDYLMRDVFHRRDALNTVPPWEAKIYSRILELDTTDPKELLEIIARRYGSWRAVAIHYLFMDLAWRHKIEPIEWYGKLMPF